MFESAIDDFFNDALTCSLNDPLMTTIVDDTPRTITSKERGVATLKLSLHRFLTKHPALWAHLLREKRTIQEPEEAAVARVRKHWEDR